MKSDAHIILEVPAAWFENPADGPRHQRFYASLLVALADLNVTVRPIRLPFGSDAAPRFTGPSQIILSFHSRGERNNVLRMKEAYIPPYYLFDRTGYSGYSEISKHADKFRKEIQSTPRGAADAFVSELRQKLVEQNLSKYQQPSTSPENIPSPYYFMPLQTVDDPVASFSYLDQLDVACALAKAADERSSSLIIKRHPLCGSRKVEKALADLDHEFSNVVVSNGSIHDLISGASAVIGCNSGVLFEAMIHGKPVVTFGNSDFQIATKSIEDLGQIPPTLESVSSWGDEFATKFLYWYLHTRCVLASDIPAIRGRIAELLLEYGLGSPSFQLEQVELFEYYSYIERTESGG